MSVKDEEERKREDRIGALVTKMMKLEPDESFTVSATASEVKLALLLVYKRLREEGRGLVVSMPQIDESFELPPPGLPQDAKVLEVLEALVDSYLSGGAQPYTDAKETD